MDALPPKRRRQQEMVAPTKDAQQEEDLRCVGFDEHVADEECPDGTLKVLVRSAMTGEMLTEVRLHPGASVAELRQAIADANGETCSLWLLLGCRLLPDRETLEEATIIDCGIVDILRCEPVPSVAPPPMAPAHLQINVRYALTGSPLCQIEVWPTDPISSLRDSVVQRQAWEGPVQLILGDGQPLVGPLSLLDAGLFDGAAIDAVRCEPRFLVTASADRTVRLLSAESGELVMAFHNDEWVNSATVSPDGSCVLATLFNNIAQLWSTKNGSQAATLVGHTAPVLWGAFAPDGRMVATASYDHSARLWNAENGELIVELVGHTDGVLSVAFSPTGQTVATASYDHSARLWNVETAECLRTLLGHVDEVRSAVFSPDGSKLATASADRFAKLWDVESGECEGTLAGHRSALSSAAFSPHGRFLVTGAADQTARLWDVLSGECLMQFEGHEDVVTSASFSTDGQLIATASADHTTRTWATESGECISTFLGHDDVVTSVSFVTGSPAE